MARRQARSQDRGRGQNRARGRARTETVRSGLVDLETGFFPEYVAGRGSVIEDLGADDERDGDLILDEGEDVDAAAQPIDADSHSTEADDEQEPAWLLRDLLGSRPPVVLVRLRLHQGQDAAAAEIKADIVVPPPSKDAAESLEELAQFLEHVFRQGQERLAAADWRRLIGLEEAALTARFLLLQRLAIEGSAKVEIRLDDGNTNKFTPHDRGLERYAAKFAALPDGTPFSLRLLLLDQRGRKDESDFGRLSPFVKLEALRRALVLERETGTACDDETFRFRFQEAVAALGIDITPPTWKQVTTLREWLKRNGLPDVFPRASDRQKAYDLVVAEAGS